MSFIRHFIAVPRIILNDQTCSQTDKLVYGMINSLSNNKEYCYASNNYFANILNVKGKTISNSINNLKRNNYIDVNFVNGQRRIYLNDKIVRQENSKVSEKKENKSIEENFQYKRKYNNINNKMIPNWMMHPEICKIEKPTIEEVAYMEKLLSEFKED